MAQQAGLALDRLLPSGVSASVGVPATDSASCAISFAVTLRHKAGTLGADAPAVTPGVMDCVGTIGSSGVEIETIDRPDPNHTVLHLKAYSTAGWGGCHGPCRTLFSVMGIEHAVMAVYK
jgi:hypothetical protein